MYCLSVSDSLDMNMYCLSVSDSFWTGMCIIRRVCVLSVRVRQSGQVCVLCVGISQVGILSVSMSLECVFSVSIRLFLDRYVYFLSV